MEASFEKPASIHRRVLPRDVQEQSAVLAPLPGPGHHLRRQQQPVHVRPHNDRAAHLGHPRLHAHSNHDALVQGACDANVCILLETQLYF